MSGVGVSSGASKSASACLMISGPSAFFSAAVSTSSIEQRLSGIESSLEKLANEVEALRKKLPASPPRRSAAKKAS